METNKKSPLDPVLENARNAYGWLRVSPILTVPTFFMIADSGIGYDLICPQGYSDCNFRMVEGVIGLLAILGSALWHLILLIQHAGQKDNFARWHIKQAMILAGIRTAIPLGFFFLDWTSGSNGFAAVPAVLVLIVFYFAGNNWGSRQAERGDCWLMRQTGHESELPALAIQSDAREENQTSPEITNEIKMEKTMSTSTPDQQEQKITLGRILAALKSDDEAGCLAAIAELGTLNFSSAAIVEQLERLALHENENLRQAALSALDLRTSIFVTSQLSSLPRSNRNVMLEEIGIWQSDGLIEPHRAEVIRRRYDFDVRKAKPMQAMTDGKLEQQPDMAAPVPSTQEAPEPVAAPAAVPAMPRPSLMQVILSESAIKIYLYLGAFFVIAAAAILAALVEAARLPVLLIVTTLFAGGAVGSKKRLPQPSFALAIVFSFLLPIDANVIADTFRLTASASNVYWTFVFLAMTFIWALGTWFYQSRLFSVAAYGSLMLAALRFSGIFEAASDWDAFSVALANFLSLAGVVLLKRWKDQKFAMPLFALTNVMQLALLAVSFSFTLIHQLESNAETGTWLAASLTWMLAASFYIASDILIPFVIFPWMAAASTFLLPWFTLSIFNASDPLFIAGFAGLGIVHALGSEVVRRTNRPALEKYHYPLLVWSLPLLFVAIIWGLTEDAWYGFAMFMLTGVIYTIIHVLRPRIYVWAAALLAGLGAYFTFFALPFMQNADVSLEIQLLGASLLLLLPELFSRGELNSAIEWRWPPLGMGALLTLINFISAVVAENAGLPTALIVVSVDTLLFAAYAIHLKRAWMGYFATALGALVVVYTLRNFELEGWLPALTTLSVVYYLGGFLLARNEERKPWSEVLVNSSLALGGILSVMALVSSDKFNGWYVLALAALFIVEMFVRKNGWLELFAEVTLSIALVLILQDFHVQQIAYHFFGVSLVWLSADMLLKRVFPARKLEVLTKIIVGLQAITTVFLLSTSLAPLNIAICLAVYTVFAVVHAWLHNEPQFGYAATILLALTVHFAAKSAGVTAWIFPQIAVAVVYYLSGSFLRRSGRAKGWDFTLFISGLGLGTLIAAVSPMQSGGLENSIPVAIAATFYAAEALARRNVWLGFPANILYLIAYFVILGELHVDEPQFFTVGAAALGLFQHYLLTRAGHKVPAFITGLVSQLILLGATYAQMLDTGELKYFFLLFFQALAVLIYGIVVRSRSLVFAPIGFVVLAVLTILFDVVRDLAPVLVIGITGLLLIGLGIGGVLMRERITDFAERFSDWDA